MTYLGRVGAVSARVHPVSQQPTEPGVGAIVATGAVTLGDYGMFRGLMTAGTEIAAHFHRTFSESFYLLDGHVQVFDGERWADVTSGDLVYVPAGGIHGLRATEDRPAEVLTIFCPGLPVNSSSSNSSRSAGRARRFRPRSGPTSIAVTTSTWSDTRRVAACATGPTSSPPARDT